MNSSNYPFEPVIHLPQYYEVLDLSSGEYKASTSEYSIGKYDERRTNVYKQELFHQELEPRNIHMGIDIGAPINTKIYTFDTARIISQAVRSAQGDYGHCMILEYIWQQDYPLQAYDCAILKGEKFWALYGHLSAASLKLHQIGTYVNKGTCIAFVGAEYENGGWTPHLHFQLTLVKPQICDLPGVVNDSEYPNALKIYPDPRQVLGDLYKDAGQVSKVSNR